MAFQILGKRNKEINKVVLLPLDQIYKSPNQPRKHFDTDSLQELSRSIAANGLLQPVTVRQRADGSYELIAGERRTLAFRALGRGEIPAIIEEYSNEQSAVFSLIENLQRKDLNYFEEAQGIAALMEELGLSQQEISSQLGKAQSTVANKLRLLKYSEQIRDQMTQYGLTERHARALLKLPDTMLQEAITEISQKSLNVEQTERLIEGMLEDDKEAVPHTRLFVVKDVRLFLNSIQKAINMMGQAGIKVDAKKQEDEQYLEYTIRIPKSEAYKPAARKTGANAAG